MSSLDRTERYSHYRNDDETPIHLVEHQRDVAERVRYLAPERATTCAGTPVLEIAEVAALVHDFGKLTTAFQRHLDGESVDDPTAHAPLGAFVGFYALDARGLSGLDALLGFVAIAKHHGALPDVATYVFDATHPDQSEGSRRIPIVRDQTKDIDDNAAGIADDILRSATDGAGSWDEFVDRMANDEWLVDVLALVTSGIGMPTSAQTDALPDDFYDALLPVWSTLTLADKTSAATLTAGAGLDTSIYDGKRPTIDRLEAKIDELQETIESDATAAERRIHELRGEAHNEVMDALDGFVAADRQVGSLTLPTGLGKTFTGLNAGLDLLSRDDSNMGRLIYALPFTSIIDQVAAECRDVFETTGHDEVLTVDHHLADTVVEEADINAADPDEAAHIEELLGESWRSGMVVTTFVQLFESLAGPSNSQSTKLPALDDSVVIIDEPQALPEAWWPLVRRLVVMLTEQYETQVIVMTATQPKVFEQDAETSPYQLVEQPERYYADLNRVVFEFDKSAGTFVSGEPKPLDYGQAAAKLLEEVEPDQSALAICNTIDSARELTSTLTDRQAFTTLNEVYDEHLAEFDGLTAEVDSETVVRAVRDARGSNEPVVLHLTTRHRPVDRRLLLKITKQLQSDDVPVFAVTTQLVEAGVDISFDYVFRDFAPMSSIVQAAGRCNRSFERDQGTVTIWLLDSPGDSQRLPSVAVYGGDNAESRPELTAQAIAAFRDEQVDERRLSEATMSWDVVNDYFERLQQRNPGQQAYVDYVTDSLIKQLSRESLITSGNAVDVVVARTHAERQLLNDIGDAFDGFEFDTLHELLDDARELQISVPLYDETSDEARRLSNLDPVHAGATLRQVKTRTDPSNAYSPLTGLSIPSETIDNRFM